MTVLEMKFIVITVSDSCASGTGVDTSGPHLIELIKRNLKSSNVSHILIPDEKEKIKNTLIYNADVVEAAAIFTCGGTGFGNRDVTPEATREVLTKEAPQLAYAMTQKGLEKTKFAILSRAVCGVRNKTLIVNFPGSKKAVDECFLSISDVIPHILQLLGNDLGSIREVHSKVQGQDHHHVHVCPHATGKGGDDRNSIYEMIDVKVAIGIILDSIENHPARWQKSSVNIPPFRASIKDGYAVKSNGGKGVKNVLTYIDAGDLIVKNDFSNDNCFKINTGAPVPDFADCIIQVEDTKVIKMNGNVEEQVEILLDPRPNLDIRGVGSDLKVGEDVFLCTFPLNVSEKSLLASIGEKSKEKHLKIAILSTGDELLDPNSEFSSAEGKIFDSNSTMLKELLISFGFESKHIVQKVVKDNYKTLLNEISELSSNCHVIVSTGGVSMGDKDFVKLVLDDFGYNIHFGRVNMKPGKPLTFATRNQTRFFGLPGNPVSAFVTFHVFVLPALRKYANTINESKIPEAKIHLPTINVELSTEKYELDPRPEYARASIVSRNGKLYAEITGKQISSRLKSIVDADVLLQLPGRTNEKAFVQKGDQLKALVLKTDFISRYDE